MPTSNPRIDKPKKPAPQDWHKADIICSLWKLGTSLQRLSREHNYSHSALGMVIYRPWPKGERIIAKALGVEPHNIWPSRYREDGTPKSKRGERGLSQKGSTGGKGVNVYPKRAA